MKISSQEELRKLYGYPSGRAKDKVFDRLDQHAQNFIAHAPFLVMSTCDAQGKMDASPRGGEPGFVKVLNEKEIVLPDGKGNNRLDSLSNILETGSVGMLFMIPGVDETLRLNGQAYVSVAPEHLSMFGELKNPPRSCVVIVITEVFLHCAKAFMRSRLWEADAQIDREQFPTMGQMLKDQLGSEGEPESREDMVRRYSKDL